MKKFFFASAIAFAIAIAPVASANMDTQSKSDVCLDGTVLTGASSDIYGYIQRWRCKYGTALQVWQLGQGGLNK